MEYNFKTRGNSTPQGKAKIYFCSYFADKEYYFDSISDEILNLFDVAVFCYTTEEEPSNIAEHFLNLKEAKMFVIPVTTNLLSKESFAITEIDFAKKTTSLFYH